MRGEEIRELSASGAAGSACATKITPLRSAPDDHINELLQRGQFDRAAAELFERYKVEIMIRAKQTLRNAQDAEDVLQETFVRAFRDLRRFRGEASLSTWLKQIADNLILDKIRYGKGKGRDLARPAGVLPEAIQPPAPGYLRPDLAAIRKERQVLLSQCVACLSDKLRSVFTRRAFQELGEQEVAEELEIALGTVKSRFNEARKQICRCLKAKTGEDIFAL